MGSCTCFECGILFGMPDHYQIKRREDKKTFYCPNGHGQAYFESTADKIRRECDGLKQQLAQKDDEIAGWKREKEKAEKEVRRVKKRASSGVCQCCNRTFTNVALHMKTKHPNVVTLKAEKVV